MATDSRDLVAMIDNVIRVEYRTANSSRPHFNLAGDWRPRLVIWPEYDGYAKDDFDAKYPEREDQICDEAWGRLVADTLTDWASERKLAPIAFRSLVHGMLTLPKRLSRAVTSNPPVWEVAAQPWHRIEPDRLNDLQHRGHEVVIYLFTERSLSDDERGLLCLHPSLDRATLLPYGESILQFGIEEAVVYVCLADSVAEERFIGKLEIAATRHGYRLERDGKPFLSHWVVANSDELGPGWDVF